MANWFDTVLHWDETTCCLELEYLENGYDILSLGSLVYFIMTGMYPYGDVASEEVERLFGVKRFPDVGGFIWGDMVMRCWQREVDFAQGVYDCFVDIERERSIDA